MDYTKAANGRKSIREFTEKPVGRELKETILGYADEAKRLLADIRTELLWVDGKERNYLESYAGYEGLTFRAPAYLVLLSQVKPGYLENAGYENEDLILHLTDMGIDSCWLTVSDEPALRSRLNLETDKRIVAVTALGYGKKELSKTRLHIKSAYDVEVTVREGHLAPKIPITTMVYQDVWGKEADLSEEYVDDGLRSALFAASFAPTFLNRQAFRFLMADGKLLLVKTMDALTGEMDAALNCGAIMLNFAVVLDERRPFKTEWTMGSPEGGYKLPADSLLVGYVRL